MTRSTARRANIRQLPTRYVVEPTHTTTEADEHVFTAYRVKATPHRQPLWLKYTIHVDPTTGANDELVFVVTEQYSDPETNTIRRGFDYEVSRPVRGYRRPLSERELERLVQRWYDDAYPSPDAESSDQRAEQTTVTDAQGESPCQRTEV
jgi:hypothetical protein